MSNVAALRLYAKNRKLPAAVKLGVVPPSWVEYATKVAEEIQDTSDAALAQRENLNIVGTEIDEYDKLVEFYNQRYCYDITLPDEITVLEGVKHLRFGVLKQGAVIPPHLDEPFTLRFICMVQGTHKFHSETGETFIMSSGELWFVNGSFKHSIENTSLSERIALLGKFERSESNLKKINELLRIRPE